MKYCDRCKISINTNNNYCPLCQQVLEGEKNNNLIEKYPDYVSPIRKIYPLTKKIILFATIVSIVILLVINLATYDENQKLWSLIPIGSIFYFWIIISFGLFSRHNIALRLVLLTALLIGLLILIDELTYDPLIALTDERWSYDYLMPFLLASCNLAISILMMVKRIDYRDYIIYLLTIVTISLVPIILVFTNVIFVAWPSILAFAIAIFIILFFFPKSIKDEIKKRFHA